MGKEKLEQIEDNAVFFLKDQVERTQESIREKVKEIVQSFQRILGGYEISEEEIEQISRKVEVRLDIKMSVGTILTAEDFKPWLDDRREEIEWYYWDRYNRLLRSKKRFPPLVISALDSITDDIIGHLENPLKEGEWSRKGLVVGDIQSGKTANYTGVICKASDVGYRVIIVLAGVINALRNQTQMRVDEGFIGVDSSRILENIQPNEKLTGVGHFSQERVPISFTTSKLDFNRGTAQAIVGSISSFSEPVILVVKKQKSILVNLIRWIRNNNLDLNRFPFLLIDDEADHASINTNRSDSEATTINSKIRELLHLFPQNSYLGYTATPFANIFIDHETDDEMLGDSLFPKDFILSLDPPDNYIGPTKIFGDDAEYDVLHEIDDFQDLIPVKHNIELRPPELPKSLKEAVRVFVLSRALRLLRNHDNEHNSMLVNVSRYTGVQSHIKLLIQDYLTELRQAIQNYAALNEKEALKDNLITKLKETWLKEFRDLEYSWIEIQKKLKSSVSPIKVIEVNSSPTSEPLDYTARNYPNGRNVIGVGGMSLSRGLTLEGLTVSYFIRNSQMYDTLMQMGRWFGYRDGYSDLCRIYMSHDASSWYSHVGEVTEELKDEFKKMKRAQLTPEVFGLCVRSHPESLIVTARNKMRTGKSVPRQISLYGRSIETSVLSRSETSIENNWKAIRRLISDILNYSKEEFDKSNILFRKIKTDHIKEFISSFDNHPASYLTMNNPVLRYIELLESDGISEWDLLLVSASEGSPSKIRNNIEDFSVKAIQRKVITDVKGAVTTQKRRFGTSGWEKAGLSQDDIENAESLYPDSKNPPGKAYRAFKTIPLLVVFVMDCILDDAAVPLFEQGIVGWLISFPGQAGTKRPEKLVEYIVNTVWWNNEYGDSMDEEELDE